MSYRKITVDEKEYEYIVGKTHVKVKGIGVWPKEEIGSVHDELVTKVKPSHVAEKIRQTV
jgi:hypothetical protein